MHFQDQMLSITTQIWCNDLDECHSGTLAKNSSTLMKQIYQLSQHFSTNRPTSGGWWHVQYESKELRAPALAPEILISTTPCSCLFSQPLTDRSFSLLNMCLLSLSVAAYSCSSPSSLSLSGSFLDKLFSVFSSFHTLLFCHGLLIEVIVFLCLCHQWTNFMSVFSVSNFSMVLTCQALFNPSFIYSLHFSITQES